MFLCIPCHVTICSMVKILSLLRGLHKNKEQNATLRQQYWNSLSVVHVYMLNSQYLSGKFGNDRRASLEGPFRVLLRSLFWYYGQYLGTMLSLTLSQLLCRLVYVVSSFVCTAHTQICAHVKDPTSICHKRVGLS